jgi:hypothetical protein
MLSHATETTDLMQRFTRMTSRRPTPAQCAQIFPQSASGEFKFV